MLLVAGAPRLTDLPVPIRRARIASAWVSGVSLRLRMCYPASPCHDHVKPRMRYCWLTADIWSTAGACNLMIAVVADEEDASLAREWLRQPADPLPMAGQPVPVTSMSGQVITDASSAFPALLLNCIHHLPWLSRSFLSSRLQLTPFLVSL